MGISSPQDSNNPSLATTPLSNRTGLSFRACDRESCLHLFVWRSPHQPDDLSSTRWDCKQCYSSISLNVQVQMFSLVRCNSRVLGAFGFDNPSTLNKASFLGALYSASVPAPMFSRFSVSRSLFNLLDPFPLLEKDRRKSDISR